MTIELLLVSMALATYRLTRLVVEDTFPPVLWLRDRMAGGWREMTPGEVVPEDDPSYRVIDGVPHRYVHRARWVPQWIADLLSCVWCASGWIAAGVTAGTWAVLGLPAPLLVWPAVWVAGALLAAQEWA